MGRHHEAQYDTCWEIFWIKQLHRHQLHCLYHFSEDEVARLVRQNFWILQRIWHHWRHYLHSSRVEKVTVPTTLTRERESCCHGSMSHTGSAPSVHHSELTHCTADWTAGKRASVFPGHPTANGFDSDHSIPHDPDEDSPTAASNRHTATLKPTCKTEEPTEQINRQQPGTSSREPADCRQPQWTN
jgi:hypothetical protein